MSNLFITTTNSNANNTSVVGIDPSTINQFVTPSTMRKEKWGTSWLCIVCCQLTTHPSICNKPGRSYCFAREQCWGCLAGGKWVKQQGNWQDPRQKLFVSLARSRHHRWQCKTYHHAQQHKEGWRAHESMHWAASWQEHCTTKAKTCCHQFNKKFLKEEDMFPQADMLVFLVISMLLSHFWQSEQWITMC